MKESNLFKSFMAAIIVIALGAPAVASADGKSDLQGVSVKVTYSDLNMEKQEAAATLYRRLQHASRQACGVTGLRNAGSVQLLAKTKACYRETLTAAVQEIDNDLLSQIHNS